MSMNPLTRLGCAVVLTALLASLTGPAVQAAPTAVDAGEPVYQTCVRDFQGERHLGAVFLVPVRWQLFGGVNRGSECYWHHPRNVQRLLGVELRPGRTLKASIKSLRRQFEVSHLSYRDDIQAYPHRTGERLAFVGKDDEGTHYVLAVQADGVRLTLGSIRPAFPIDQFVFRQARRSMLIAR